MIHRLTVIAALLAAAAAHAQYEPPSPALPVPGAIDAWLRAGDPAAKAWDVGINERLRFEDKEGAGTTHAGSNFDFFANPPTTNSNRYWISRLMPRVAYTGDWISFAVEERTSYSWQDDRFNPAAAGRGLTDNDGPAQLELANVTLGNLKRFPLTLKIGRQELTYGEQRLVGAAMWLNVPHSFDAVKMRYQNAFFGVDAFSASPVYGRGSHFDQSNAQDRLSGIYFDFPGLSKTQVEEAYVFAHNVARGIVTDDWTLVPAPFRFPAPQDVYTVGVRTKTKPSPTVEWDYGIEAMYQFGNRTAVFPATPVAAAKAAPRLTQEAWAYVIQGGHTWQTVPMKPRLAVILSGASGDRTAGDDRSNTFQNLWPSNHGLYGMMDLSPLQNLQDLRLSLLVKPTPTTRVTLDLHQQYLTSTSDYWYNAAGAPRNTPGAAAGSGRGFGINPSYSSDLGQEADLLGGWTPVKGLLLEAGAGHYFSGRYITQSLSAVGSRDANYGYVQVTINL